MILQNLALSGWRCWKVALSLMVLYRSNFMFLSFLKLVSVLHLLLSSTNLLTSSFLSRFWLKKNGWVLVINLLIELDMVTRFMEIRRDLQSFYNLLIVFGKFTDKFVSLNFFCWSLFDLLLVSNSFRVQRKVFNLYLGSSLFLFIWNIFM